MMSVRECSVRGGEEGTSMRPVGPLDTLEDVLGEVPDLVFAFGEDGRYLFINNAASGFLGSSPMDVIGQHWRDLGYSGQVMVPLLEAVRDVFETGVSDFYHTMTSPERGSKSLDISLTPLKSEDEIVAVLAICRDVTRYMSCL
jgi:PAS domain S-box-containing protein